MTVAAVPNAVNAGTPPVNMTPCNPLVVVSEVLQDPVHTVRPLEVGLEPPPPPPLGGVICASSRLEANNKLRSNFILTPKSVMITLFSCMYISPNFLYGQVTTVDTIVHV